MRELTDLDELADVAGDDLLCCWAGQRLITDGRAWATDDGRAVVVAAPGLATRDRLAVHGSMSGCAGLVGLALAEVGPSFRPIGDRQLIHQIVGMIELPGGRSLETVAEFGWMERHKPLDDAVSPAHWLDDSDLDDIAALLGVAAPHSDARPGDPDVDGWAGIRDDDGRLITVAALAWSAPSVGYLCGVATHPEARGQGLATQVCRLVADEAITTRGSVALMVDDDNPAAVAVYRHLGLSYRQLSAAHVQDRI